jgi:serine phosphatase RsbU (regulator of sigma subunit)
LGNNANVNIQQLVNVWYGDKQPITFESLHKTKSGKDIWIQTTLTPILDESGKIYRMIAIDSDISKLKNIESELLEKNEDITSSISYAKQIQQAMMPPFSIINDFYQDSYYLLKPKSIVSGDFYWTTFKNNRLVVVCADSTGHGVPGAFMSMIGMSFLNKIVNEKGFVAPDIILNRMRKNIITHLHQSKSGTVSNDGMDMAVVSIDVENYQLDFAGAMNPIYIIRNNNLIELKPDKMPVGFIEIKERPFSSTSLSLEKNDTVFMFTDGYQDQFGGKTGNKMKRQKLKNIFIEAATLPSEEQGLFIENEFYKWKGNNHQVDDVLIISLIIN